MWASSIIFFVPLKRVASNDQTLPQVIESLRHARPHRNSPLVITSNKKANANEASILFYTGRTPRDAVRFVIKGGAKIPRPGSLLLYICALALHGRLLDQLDRDF